MGKAGSYFCLDNYINRFGGGGETWRGRVRGISRAGRDEEADGIGAGEHFFWPKKRRVAPTALRFSSLATQGLRVRVATWVME